MVFNVVRHCLLLHKVFKGSAVVGERNAPFKGWVPGVGSGGVQEQHPGGVQEATLTGARRLVWKKNNYPLRESIFHHYATSCANISEALHKQI
ncbi:hypothetical protein HOLleu_06058 [Holothuria leucospilota]|uniref:Uncharacterized protein n=1 Tax=Holothuria leucospilota TaxID=206669 RepID=A0A9Q1HIN6_HOLLE|nr:hypothetical protein HOLleu_06058 [Holothuria leucospilota]